MKKRARRLWLGDWQRDQPAVDASSADPTDTVLLAPVEEEEEPQAPQQREERRAARPWIAAVVVAAAAFALLLAIASRHHDQAIPDQALQQPPQAQAPQAQVPQGGPQSFYGGPDLTGAGAIRAARAALAKYPGTVERVSAGPGGGYIVHVFRGDGTELHVLVGRGFHVQGSDAGAAPPTFGSGGTSQ